MEPSLIRTTVDEWTRGLDPVAARIKVFETVRDFPYVYPAERDPIWVLRRGGGSCSGKHYLLGALFRELGLPVRPMICTHRFNEGSLVYPDDMQEILRRNEVVDLHDYLQVEIDGRWIEVDCTWPRSLREFGFPVNEEWDGRMPMVLSVAAEEEHEVTGAPEKMKSEMLAQLTPRQRAIRKQFLERLGDWVRELEEEGEAGA